MFRPLLLACGILAASVHVSYAQIFIPIYISPAIVPDAKTADYKNIHTVAVISALGSQFVMHNNHFIAPIERQLDIQDWKIDEEIEIRLKQYLSNRFSFKQVSFDHAALAKISDGQFGGLGSNFSGFLRSLPTDQVDAYIVVRRGLAYSAPGIEGLGLENGAPFGDATPVVWTNFEINIVDAKTSKVIAEAYSRVRLRDNTPPSFSGIFASDILKVDDKFNLSDKQKLVLHETVSSALNLSIVETLRTLNIASDLPAAGTRTMVPIPPDQSPYKTYRNVAVVSGLGSKLNVEHAGYSILSHDTYPAMDTNWDLDTLLEKRAGAALAKHFNIVTADVDRAAFSKTVLRNEDHKWVPAIYGLPNTPDIDLYVLLVPVKEPIWGRYETAGPGLFNKTGLDPEETFIYAHYAIAAVDARTMKLVMGRIATMDPTHANKDVHEAKDKSFWSDAKPPEFTDAQKDDIKNSMYSLLNDSADETLLDLGLLGVIPEIGTPIENNPPSVQIGK